MIDVPAGGAIMKECIPMSGFNVALPLEGYPNRDSLKYSDLYGIPEAETVIRGTLRYQVCLCTLSPCVYMLTLVLNVSTNTD